MALEGPWPANIPVGKLLLRRAAETEIMTRGIGLQHCSPRHTDTPFSQRLHYSRLALGFSKKTEIQMGAVSKDGLVFSDPDVMIRV